MSAPITVAILGGNFVARTLELLLQGVGYRTRSAMEASPGDLEENILDGVQLLLLVPGLHPKLRGAALSAAGGSTPRLPVLELVAGLRPEQEEDREHSVPWPCRTEDLKRRIEDTLAEGRAEQ
jgi:hypothetical protein